jgi:hypothetical protein
LEALHPEYIVAEGTTMDEPLTLMFQVLEWKQIIQSMVQDLMHSHNSSEHKAL